MEHVLSFDAFKPRNQYRLRMSPPPGVRVHKLPEHDAMELIVSAKSGKTPTLTLLRALACA